MSKGWISLHRKIQDCWIWEDKPYDKARAWIDLLLSASHSDKKIMSEGRPVEIPRGSVLTSILKLSDRWGWSKGKVKRYFDELENDNMITTKRTNRWTIVNIVNYGIYNDKPSRDEPTDEPSDKPSDGKQTDHIQQLKQCKQYNNNIYGDSDGKSQADDKHFANDWFEACWKAYPRKKGKGQVKDATKKRLAKEVGLGQMLRCIERYKAEMVGKDEQYVMYGSTFFNSGYVDYLDENYETETVLQCEQKRSDDNCRQG